MARRKAATAEVLGPEMDGNSAVVVPLVVEAPPEPEPVRWPIPWSGELRVMCRRPDYPLDSMTSWQCWHRRANTTEFELLMGVAVREVAADRTFRVSDLKILAQTQVLVIDDTLDPNSGELEQWFDAAWNKVDPKLNYSEYFYLNGYWVCDATICDPVTGAYYTQTSGREMAFTDSIGAGRAVFLEGLLPALRQAAKVKRSCVILHPNPAIPWSSEEATSREEEVRRLRHWRIENGLPVD